MSKKKVKVVINRCFGGFSLSEAAQKALGLVDDPYPTMSRSDPKLVKVVEKLGDKANGRFAKLQVMTVVGPYRITEYDGQEGIEQPSNIAWENE